MLFLLLSNDTGSGTGDGKKALYHCNYCNKDISGKIRIKCTKCPDFDLCLECFTVGAEVHPHKSNHPYRVMVRDFTVEYFFMVLTALSIFYFLNYFFRTVCRFHYSRQIGMQMKKFSSWRCIQMFHL